MSEFTAPGAEPAQWSFRSVDIADTHAGFATAAT